MSFAKSILLLAIAISVINSLLLAQVNPTNPAPFRYETRRATKTPDPNALVLQAKIEGQMMQRDRAKGADGFSFLSPDPIAFERHAQQTLPGPAKTLPYFSNNYANTPRLNDICEVISGRNFIFQDSLVLWSGEPSVTNDGYIILSGEFGHYDGSTNSYGGFCLKADWEGNVLWSRYYDSTDRKGYHFINYFRSLVLANGNILLVARTNNAESGNQDLMLTMLTSEGDIIWNNTYESRTWQGFNGSGDYFAFFDLLEDPSTSEIYLGGKLWGGGATITKISPVNGQIIWSNGWTSFDIDNTFGMVIEDGRILLFTSNFIYATCYVGAMSISKTTGQELSHKTISYTATPSSSFVLAGVEAIKLDNGHYRLAGRTLGYYEFPSYTGTQDLYHATIIDLDENLDFFRAWGFKNKIESNGYNTKVTLFPDGSGIFSMLRYIGPYDGEGLISIFQDETIYHQRKRLHIDEGIPNEPWFLQREYGSFINIKLMGSESGMPAGGSRIDFYRMHSSDILTSCAGMADSSTSLWYDFYLPYNSVAATLHANILRESKPQTISTGTMQTYKGPACSVQSGCDTLDIRISSQYICPGNVATVTIHKNAACGSFVPLTWDASFTSEPVKINDTTYQFLFTQPGSGYIGASLMGCMLLKDSVFVEVAPVRYEVDLGPDTVICPNNQLQLNAGAGFDSYIWQDGSTDSILAITSPGIYYVTVSNSCGGSFSDTIVVNDHPLIPLEIGPDRVKCNADTLQIHAPAGFINYTWYPDYAINNTSAASVTVSPDIDTIYYLQAEKSPGCFAYDSIRIHVNYSPAIYLGEDTSFCSGDSILLDAGASFDNYYWNTGSGVATITIKEAGTYIVQAVAQNGCTSSDTLSVREIFALPQVILPPPASICTGESFLLDAGDGYISYTWSTGSTGRSVQADSVGQYHVVVVDNNGCVGSGSSQVLAIHALPQNFLSGDTAICSYGSIELRPLQAFQSYQWSSGSNAEAIRISQPGEYWLQVSDHNNCSGRDTVIVTRKDCMTGFYAPKAFTPNGDGLNDDFKPLIFGNIEYYEFTVYNRWGQVVYRSQQPGSGWNGRYAGTRESGNVFVWVCTYQLSGESKRLERGTVTLIR